MHSVQPQSLTDSELLRYARLLLIESEVGDKRGAPIAWQWELVNRLEKRVADNPGDHRPVINHRQGKLF